MTHYTKGTQSPSYLVTLEFVRLEYVRKVQSYACDYLATK